jgi:hypothetical protein
MSACASQKPVLRPATIIEQSEEPNAGWWYARYRIKWPENTPPAWNVDLAIAHGIIAPVLYKHESDLALWRFHRRAVRDKRGHQFSFIFYAPQKTAHQIFIALGASGLLQEMKDSGVIVKEIYDNTDKIKRPLIEDTSDKKWSPQIQKSWPYYIMGVSRMWLAAIEEIGFDLQPEVQFYSLESRLDFYRQVNDRLLQLWREEGQHSFLHHLYALFGYEPTRIFRFEYMRF